MTDSSQRFANPVTTRTQASSTDSSYSHTSNIPHRYLPLHCEALRDIELSRNPPQLVLLSGLQGSGKSTFAAQLVEQGWCRISQDELGSRQRCELECITALTHGLNVVIDRCNFNVQQRSIWIQIAFYRRAVVGAILFATPPNECIRRIMNRANHPTLPPSEQAKAIVQRTAQDFEPPSRSEAIDWCRIIRKDSDFQRVYKDLLEFNPID